MLKLPAGKTDSYFVIGKDDDGKVGIGLQPGQIATITSEDPATVSISPDTLPGLTSEDLTEADGTVVPAGTMSIASGKVVGAAAPAQPNVAINVTCKLTNADGTPVLDDENNPIPDLVDTVTVVPGLLKSEGFLFGSTPVAS